MIKDLFNITFCNRHRDRALDAYFRRITTSLNLRHTFNPSFYYDHKITVLAFRGIFRTDGSNASFISVEDETGHMLINISAEYGEQLGAPRLIDPKVVTLNDGIYATFHSGHIESGNDIFLMKVHPTLEPPKRIHYANRQTQERNWAFFSDGGDLYALYWINPLTILRATHSDDTIIEFEDHYTAPGSASDIPTDLTIGTQLSKFGDRYYCVAHKKVPIRKRKMYLGRLCALDFAHTRIELGSTWLAHSLTGILDGRRKENTNLFSCTYFSGLQVTKSTIRLGYGVNDIRSGFSKHPRGTL